MTVFSGFGVFTANSAHIYYSGGMQSALGYLSQREFAYCLAVFAWRRGEANPAWAKELTSNVRIFMRDSLAYFKATGRTI